MPSGRAPRFRDWFTVSEAARLSGLTKYMVQYLNRSGIVTPSHSPQERARKGLRSKYTFADLVALRAVAHFLKQGVLVSRLKRALASLRSRYPEIGLEQVPARYLVMDGGRQLYFADDRGAMERLSDGQLVFAFVLEFEQVRDEVKTKLSKEQREIAALSELRHVA